MTEDNTAELLALGLGGPTIGQIQRLELRPGEVLVVTMNSKDVDSATADRVKVIVESKLPKGSRVLVTPKGTEFSIVSPAVADDYEAAQQLADGPAE
jgi:hypothetical protein